MNGSREDTSRKGTILVCGKPLFLRQAMSAALQDVFGGIRVQQVADQEPPALHVPETVQWMIWFLNFKYESNPALVALPAAPTPLNLVVVEGDGRVLLRRAEQAHFQSLDVSLQELLCLIKGSIDEQYGQITGSRN